MSKVVLHVGTHKTATTTIQDTFFENKDLLADQGVIYPKFENQTGHHGLVSDWGDIPENYRLPAGSLGTLKELNDRYAKSDTTVFLSSEEFVRGHPDFMVDFKAVREALAGFDEIQVVCVLRPQWQYLQSIYLEVSKVKVAERPAVFAWNAIRSGRSAGLWADYRKILGHLLTAFSLDEITFLDFETCKQSDGGILGSFLQLLDLQLSASELNSVNSGASNVSPLPLVTYATNVLSEPRTGAPWVKKAVERAMKNHFQTHVRQCIFSRDEFLRLQRHYGRLNEGLARELASTQPGFSITEAQSSMPSLFRDDLTSEFWIKAAQEMCGSMHRAIDSGKVNLSEAS